MRDFIAWTAAAGRTQSYEDVPISLCLYDFLKLEETPKQEAFGVRLVCRDTPLVIPHGEFMATRQRREGYRWGLSAAWDRKTPHYMLPAELVRTQPPKGSLYVTAAQPFDFIYSVFSLISDLENHQRTRYRGVEGCPCPVDPELALDIVSLQSFAATLPDGWFLRMGELVKLGNDRFMKDKFELHALKADGKTIGFAMLWFEGFVCYHVHRLLLPQWRNMTRQFDLYLAKRALSRGCKWLNIGDGHRAPGLSSYKFELRPAKLGFYVNVLDREEIADYDLPA